MRYHLSTLRRQVEQLKAKLDDGAIITLNLNNGEIRQIRDKDICKWGANALFNPAGPEAAAIKNATNSTESNGKMVELLKMVLGYD